MASLNVGSLGEYIREQRRSAQYSLRQLADAAGVSNPYLSQIERGLRKPSAEILQQIAKALRISAESLYVQAGILDERDRDGLEVHSAILTDPTINERQKQVLLQIYESFRKENGAADGAPPPPGSDREAPGAAISGRAAKKTAARKRTATRANGERTAKAAGAPVKRVAGKTAEKVARKVAGRAARPAAGPGPVAADAAAPGAAVPGAAASGKAASGTIASGTIASGGNVSGGNASATTAPGTATGTGDAPGGAAAPAV